MLDSIKRFVTGRILRPESATPGSAHASPATEGAGSKPGGIGLAACALLLELANADQEFSVSERRHIESALARHFGLDEATSRELIELADTERRESIDHFQFTRLINQSYDLGQKMVLAEVMWGVVLADGQIASHESYLMRKLAS